MNRKNSIVLTEKEQENLIAGRVTLEQIQAARKEAREAREEEYLAKKAEWKGYLETCKKLWETIGMLYIPIKFVEQYAQKNQIMDLVIDRGKARSESGNFYKSEKTHFDFFYKTGYYCLDGVWAYIQGRHDGVHNAYKVRKDVVESLEACYEEYITRPEKVTEEKVIPAGFGFSV